MGPEDLSWRRGHPLNNVEKPVSLLVLLGPKATLEQKYLFDKIENTSTLRLPLNVQI